MLTFSSAVLKWPRSSGWGRLREEPNPSPSGRVSRGPSPSALACTVVPAVRRKPPCSPSGTDKLAPSRMGQNICTFLVLSTKEKRGQLADQRVKTTNIICHLQFFIIFTPPSHACWAWVAFLCGFPKKSRPIKKNAKFRRTFPEAILATGHWWSVAWLPALAAASLPRLRPPRLRHVLLDPVQLLCHELRHRHLLQGRGPGPPQGPLTPGTRDMHDMCETYDMCDTNDMCDTYDTPGISTRVKRSEDRLKKKIKHQQR